MRSARRRPRVWLIRARLGTPQLAAAGLAAPLPSGRQGSESSSQRTRVVLGAPEACGRCHRGYPAMQREVQHGHRTSRARPLSRTGPRNLNRIKWAVCRGGVMGNGGSRVCCCPVVCERWCWRWWVVGGLRCGGWGMGKRRGSGDGEGGGGGW